MNTGIKYILASAVGGLIYGAVGGAVASSSKSHPILKSSLVVGGIVTVVTTFVVAVQSPKQLGLTGIYENPRFP